jgi:FtsZ-interacting cell division protein ZipA
MIVLIVLIAIAITIMLVFAAYWTGRDKGETAAYAQARMRDDVRTEKILGLLLENERLREALAQPTLNVWNNVRVPDQSPAEQEQP